MAEAPEYFYTQVRAKAKIGGLEVPLLGTKVKYALNEIPTARLKIALGRGMTGKGAGKTSSGHGLLDSIQPFTPVEIEAKFEAPEGKRSASQEDDGLTGDYQPIFKGFLFTPEQTKDRAGGSAGLEFSAVGYPAALGGSTQFVAGLAGEGLDGSGADKITANMGKGSDNLSNVDQLITKGGDKREVDKFILDLFDQLTGLTATYSGDLLNNSARLALERMANNPLDAPPMTLNYGDVKKEYYERALTRFYTGMLWGNWMRMRGGADLWDILLKFAEMFRFCVVPAIEKDALVPVTMGLAGEPWRSYEPSDYWTVSMIPTHDLRSFYTYVGSVGMVLPEKHHGLFQEKQPIGAVVGFAKVDGVKYDAAGGVVEPRLVMIDPPEFLICPGPPSLYTGLGAVPSPDAADPETGSIGVQFGKQMDLWYSKSLGNGYAGAHLYDMLFAHRVCTIAGRFRLDIAPGSLIQLRTIGERFMGESEKLFGHALDVTLTISPEGTGTAVTLGSVRTENEHENFTTPYHPMYDGTLWRGAMLTGE